MKYTEKAFKKIWKGPELGLLYSGYKEINVPYLQEDGTYDSYPYTENYTSAGVAWLGGLHDRSRTYGQGLAQVGIEPGFTNLWIGIYDHVKQTEKYMLHESHISNERGQGFTGSDEVYIDIGLDGFEWELNGALKEELSHVKLINMSEFTPYNITRRSQCPFANWVKSYMDGGTIDPKLQNIINTLNR